MNKKQPIICEMCLEQIDEYSSKRVYDLNRKYRVAMAEHKSKCKLWNDSVARVLGLQL